MSEVNNNLLDTKKMLKEVNIGIQQLRFRYYYLSYSKMAAYVSLADGIEDHDTDSFKINNTAENIKIIDNNEKTQIPVLGEITIEEITES